MKTPCKTKKIKVRAHDRCAPKSKTPPKSVSKVKAKPPKKVKVKRVKMTNTLTVGKAKINDKFWAVKAPGGEMPGYHHRKKDAEAMAVEMAKPDFMKSPKRAYEGMRAAYAKTGGDFETFVSHFKFVYSSDRTIWLEHEKWSEEQRENERRLYESTQASRALALERRNQEEKDEADAARAARDEAHRRGQIETFGPAAKYAQTKHEARLKLERLEGVTRFASDYDRPTHARKIANAERWLKYHQEVHGYLTEHQYKLGRFGSAESALRALEAGEVEGVTAKPPALPSPVPEPWEDNKGAVGEVGGLAVWWYPGSGFVERSKRYAEWTKEHHGKAYTLWNEMPKSHHSEEMAEWHHQASFARHSDGEVADRIAKRARETLAEAEKDAKEAEEEWQRLDAMALAFYLARRTQNKAAIERTKGYGGAVESANGWGTHQYGNISEFPNWGSDVVAKKAASKTKPKRPTFAAARKEIFTALAADGWDVKTFSQQTGKNLKVPHATHLSGVRLWFKAQAVYVGHKSEKMGLASSMHTDIRDGTDKFMEAVSAELD